MMKTETANGTTIDPKGALIKAIDRDFGYMHAHVHVHAHAHPLTHCQLMCMWN